MFISWTTADGESLNVFHVEEVLKELGVTDNNCTVSVNPKSANGLILETADEGLARKLMEVVQIRDQIIQSTDATKENSLKCVVKCIAANANSTEEILAQTRSQGVIQVDRKKGKRGTLVLSMRAAIPERIRLGPIWLRTQVFVPRPMLCRSCFCYGHPERQCRNIPACPRCSKEHTLDPAKKCTRRVECRNCKGGHESVFGGCPVWKQECAIKKLMRTENIHGAEARSRYKTSCKGRYFELSRGTKRTVTPTIVEVADDEDSDSSEPFEVAAKPTTKEKSTTAKTEQKSGGSKRKSVSKDNEDDTTPPKKGKGGKKSVTNLSLTKATKTGSNGSSSS